MSNYLDSPRQLSVYEKQQLLKYKLSEVDLLKNGEMPVEYFTTKVDFAGLTLNINNNVLIPRIETEELSELALKIIKDKRQSMIKVLDLGTGSGAIVLALINQLSLLNYLSAKWEFYLFDYSAEAISLAKKNYQQFLAKVVNEDNLKINFLVSNLLEKCPHDLQFDLILANLPYIPSEQIQFLPASVKDFEPILALDGGKTGFELIARAIEQLLSNNLLNKNTVLLFETYHTHNQKFLKKHYPNLFELFDIVFIKDQFDKQRFLQIKIKA